MFTKISFMTDTNETFTSLFRTLLFIVINLIANIVIFFKIILTIKFVFPENILESICEFISLNKLNVFVSLESAH
jgi:hypothetical protein